MKYGIKKYIQDFLYLVYPDTCCGCGRDLLRHEEQICLHCISALPRFDNTKDENTLLSRFYGKSLPLKIFSLYEYRKYGAFQQVLFSLKYRNNPETGIVLGRKMGILLKELPADLQTVDFLVPVPISKEKIKVRGYNQSEQLAMGIREILNIEMLHALERKNSRAQSSKSRWDRWVDIEKLYSPVQNIQLYNKHILLIDDILTTGATLSACRLALEQAGVKKVTCMVLAAKK